MALIESLTGYGSVKAFVLSAFALRKAPLLERSVPMLPWLPEDTVAEPALDLAVRRPPRAVKPTPQISARQLLDWGAKARIPLGEHPVQMHAFTLLNYINSVDGGFNLDNPGISKGKIRRGLFAHELEEAYILMCAEVMWWKPLRWEGSNGVGEHFRRLSKQKKRYAYTIDVRDGIEKRWCFYPVPAPERARKPRKRTPEPTPKTGAKTRAKVKPAKVSMRRAA